MKVRQLHLSSKLFLSIVMVILTTDALIGVILYTQVSALMMRQIRDNSLNISKSLSKIIDTETLKDIKDKDDFNSPSYNKIHAKLASYAKKSQVEYIYTVRRTDDGSFVYGVDSDSEAPALPGDEFSDPYKNYEKAYTGKHIANKKADKDEWGNHITAYSPIYDENQEVISLLCVDLDANWIRKQVNKISLLLFTVCATVLIIGLILLFIMRRKLKFGFTALNDKVLDLSDGSGDLTKEIIMSNENEFIEIAGNMNKFIRQIRTLVQDVSTTAKNIMKNGHSMNAALVYNTQSIYNVNESILKISANMQECSSITDTINSGLEDTEHLVQEFADKVSAVENIAINENQNASVSYKKAKQHRAETLQTIERIKNEMKAAISDAREIDKIRDISKQISEIADQTKMLSLNAQIEAARAGDSGKGFAVVATEVERLSSAISEAVKDMNEISVSAVQSVEILMNSSVKMSNFMRKNVVGDYNSFVEISRQYVTSTNTLQKNMQDLKADSTKLVNLMDDISINILAINKAVGDSASQAEALSQSSADITNQMSELENISSQNEMQSSVLYDKIEKYSY